ncbi:hypothetical protein ACHAPT_010176 [Fusarium lateritium]
MRFSLSTLVALGALQTLGVNAQDSTSCINKCSQTLQVNVEAYNCPDGSVQCICAATEFAKGMAECARPCGVPDSDIIGNLRTGFCVGQAEVQLPAATAASSEASSAPATTSGAAASTSEAPATTEAASSSVAPTSSAAPEITTSSAAESVPASTSAAAESTATESAAASDSTAASATDKPSTTEGAAGADATSDSSEDDKDEESSGSGLSKSAQIGIGVGVAAGVLALLGIALCFFLRRRSQRNNLPRGNTAMPPPMPAAGGNYNSTDQGSIGEKNGYDLEMMSHRYEDMLPRQKPRTMV